MIYAISEGNRLEATPGQHGICPQCKCDVIPKCGKIKVWHWAHKSRIECDNWWEPESEWHQAWKKIVNPNACEVVIGNHRADIVGNNGIVIELQSSSISIDEILERELFYKKMIWIFNANKFYDRFYITKRQGVYGPYCTFRWDHARKSISYCTKPVFFHISQGDVDIKRGCNWLFQIKRFRQEGKFGWGNLCSKKFFYAKYFSHVL